MKTEGPDWSAHTRRACAGSVQVHILLMHFAGLPLLPGGNSTSGQIRGLPNCVPHEPAVSSVGSVVVQTVCDSSSDSSSSSSSSRRGRVRTCMAGSQ
jgi:hypothetical protein